MGSPGVQFWLRYFLTSISAISLQPHHPSMHMQTTLHSCTPVEVGRRLRIHSQLTWMSSLLKYLRTWRLKLSSAKTTATPFTLNTKEAHKQLTVKLDGSTLPCNPTPTYLGVKMDRQLTFKQHIEALRGKVASRHNLLRRLAGSSWGAHPSTLRTGALALVYSAAEYAAPAWCRSTHVKKTGCYSQRHHENSQWMHTTIPSEIPPCPLGNCSTCTS